ncbi:MAG: GtrA family protein [Gammaproteobacteria bacterium]|nr:GtrA family protein [Gammaproteobacteria bacterium]
MKKLFWSFTFLKSQISAIVATAVDFFVLFFLVEFIGSWYVLAAAVAAFCGAVTNFLLGRHWTFLAHDDKWHHQAQRYMLVAGGSLGLNTLGIFLLTDGLAIHYMISKVIISFFVAVAFNFPLQKYFVFKK